MRKRIIGTLLFAALALVCAGAPALAEGADAEAVTPALSESSASARRLGSEAEYVTALMESLPESGGAQAGLVMAWEYANWLQNRQVVDFEKKGLLLVSNGSVVPSDAVMSIDGASKETTYLHSWQARYTAALTQTASMDSLLKEWNAQLRMAADFTTGEDGIRQTRQGGATPMQRTDEQTPEELLSWYEGIVPLGYLQAKDAVGDVVADMMYYVVGVKEESPYGVASYVFTRFYMEREDGTREVRYFNSANPSVGFKIAGLVAQEEQEPSGGGQAAATDAKSGESIAAPKQVKIREGGSVNVRRTSNPSSELVGLVSGGAVVECLSVAKNGWYEIRLENGKIAFVSGKLASPVE